MTKKQLFLISIPLFLLASCQNKQAEQPAAAGSNSKTTTVEVVNPSRNAFTAEVQITGSAMPNQQVTLHAMESGFVKSIRKDIGDAVQKGEVIAVLENPDLVQLLKRAEAGLSRAKAVQLKADANLLKAQAMEKAATAAANRLNAVFVKTPSLTPVAEVERAQASAASALADVSIAKAEIEAAKKEVAALMAEKDAVSMRIQMLTVRAPFSGIVTKRYVDDGAAIQSGLSNSNPKPIVEIQATNPIRLTLPLPESDAAAVRTGMEVTVSFPELPGESFKAKVSRTANAIDPTSGTMQVEIDLPNSKSTIKPGMYAKVAMQISSRKDVLSLPQEAQVMDKDEFFLLLVKDGKVVQVPLKKGLSSKEFFEVLNSDVTEASQVIVQGKGLVKAGQMVEPVLKKN